MVVVRCDDVIAGDEFPVDGVLHVNAFQKP